VVEEVGAVLPWAVVAVNLPVEEAGMGVNLL